MVEVTYLIGGIIIVFTVISTWLVAKYIYNQQNQKNLFENYIHKTNYDIKSNELRNLRNQKEDISTKYNLLNTNHAILKTEFTALEKHHDMMKRDSLSLQSKFKSEFEVLSQRILEDKSAKFTHINSENIKNILAPLQLKIKTFEASIEKKHISEVKDRSALQKEIEHLRTLNTQLSNDANNLARALKGDNKTQGDWGEYRLELLLEKSGLKKDVHFVTQNSYRDEDGNIKRPDFIISLPNNKNIIVDSKVSLKAYDSYLSTDEPIEKKNHLRLLLESIKLHIRDLNSKKYDELYEIETPNYVLMFIPLEPALTLASEFDKDLFLSALEKNIVLVSTSTLLATLRTISFIWTQDTQRKSVLEIAKQSGLLYDKLHGFISDLENIGSKLDSAQNSYHSAFNKLIKSSKKGDTIIGRAEKLKQLGAITKKQIKAKEIE